MASIFISYARRDGAALAQRLVERELEAGWQPEGGSFFVIPFFRGIRFW
jgi:hypothetical protein